MNIRLVVKKDPLDPINGLAYYKNGVLVGVAALQQEIRTELSASISYEWVDVEIVEAEHV